MNKPSRLSRGDTIGVIAPAAAMAEADINRTAQSILDLGFRVQVSPQAIRKDSYFGADPFHRAKDLEAMFFDSRIAGIMCVKGGYGSIEILPHLDYEQIARHPKVFIGYSDITALLIAISTRSDMVTYHGPMLHSFIKRADQFTLDSLRGVLTDPALSMTLLEGASGPVVLRPGTAAGPLVGGNLTLLSHLLGTEYDFDISDSILFIEDIDEDLYRVERSLIHLKMAGKLSNINALVVGKMVDVRIGKIPLGKDLAEVVLGVCVDTAYPIVMDFPCGHATQQMTLPIGVRARIAAREEAVEFGLLETAVLF